MFVWFVVFEGSPSGELDKNPKNRFYSTKTSTSELLLKCKRALELEHYKAAMSTRSAMFGPDVMTLAENLSEAVRPQEPDLMVPVNTHFMLS